MKHPPLPIHFETNDSVVPETWFSSSQPPERYEIVSLLFADGRIRRGTWTGRIWWGYDELVHRSRPLEPIAWRRLWE